MSKYERWALILSVIAILIPLVQCIWKKWIVATKVNFYPAGQATLFFNLSGSYIRFNGVLEAEHKAATIKKMSIVLSRQRDDRKLKLEWSYLISPVNQSMLGNYVQTTEAAHPFRVEADSIACAFVEYSDPLDSAGIKIRKKCADMEPLILQIVKNREYDDAVAEFSKTTEYIDAKNSLSNDFFWEIGKYTIDVLVEYDKRKKKSFSFDFTVSEHNYMELLNNIDELLITKLKEYYKVLGLCKSIPVEIKEITT